MSRPQGNTRTWVCPECGQWGRERFGPHRLPDRDVWDRQTCTVSPVLVELHQPPSSALEALDHVGLGRDPDVLRGAVERLGEEVERLKGLVRDATVTHDPSDPA